MAEVFPFRGILYNTQKITDLSRVVVPPFDVISREEQQVAYDCHPYNMIRLELNRGSENGAGDADPHGLAAAHFSSWLDEGILVRDREPAFYLTATDFQIGSQSICRFGFIGCTRLTPFEEGQVLPHEKTFSGVRSERLELMKACHANFSPIFAMYRDPKNALLQQAAASVDGRSPRIDFVDANGHRHRLWSLSGADIAGMSAALAGSRIYIADGHHRYETALAYLRWMQKTHGTLPPDHPARCVMMYLTAMESEGLVILPAHRLLKKVPKDLRRHLLDRADDFFDVERLPANGSGSEPDVGSLKTALERHVRPTSIGVAMKEDSDLYLLRLREGVMEQRFGGRLAPELIDIDVTALRQLLFMEIMGFDNRRLDNHELIGYASTVEQGVEKVVSGEYDIGFLLNPTRIDQVRRIAEAGLIMPRKATYFYPKVISGLVINSLRPEAGQGPADR